MKTNHPSSPAILRAVACVCLVILLAGCNLPNLSVPSAGTPAAVSATPKAATPTSRATSAPTRTPTALPHLQVLEEDLDGMMITFMHPLDGAQAQTLRELAVEFNNENEWGIIVDVVETGSLNHMVEEVTTQLENGDSPNVILAPVENVLAWQEQVINVDSYAKDAVWGLPPGDAADFQQALWQVSLTADRQIGLPALATTNALFYNQTWAQELGFSNPPTTFAEFKEQACSAAVALTSDETSKNDGTGGWILNTSALTTLSWLHSAGVQPLEDDVFTFNTADARKTMRDLRSMYDQGCIWSSRLPTPYDYFANRQALFYSATLEQIPEQEAASAFNASTDKWMLIPYPTFENQPSALFTTSVYSLMAATKEQQMAGWLFMRYMTSSQADAALAETGFTIPARKSSLETMSSFRSNHPQWAQAQNWTAFATPVPPSANWRIARYILEDAAWQAFQSDYIKPEDIPTLLNMLDDTIAEIIAQEG